MTYQKVSQPPQEARPQFKSFNDGCGVEVGFYWKIKSDTFEPLMAFDQFALQSSRPVSRLLYLWQLPVSLPVSAKPKSLTWQRRPLQPRQSIFGLSAWHFTCHQHYTMCAPTTIAYHSAALRMSHTELVRRCFLPLSQQQLQTCKTIRENTSGKKEKKSLLLFKRKIKKKSQRYQNQSGPAGFITGRTTVFLPWVKKLCISLCGAARVVCLF